MDQPAAPDDRDAQGVDGRVESTRNHQRKGIRNPDKRYDTRLERNVRSRIQTTNQYKKLLAQGMAEKEAKKKIWASNRGNARTPMHWSSEVNAGFSTVAPWIPINENFIQINAADQLKDEKSIYHFYKEIIQLRKNHETLIYGSYELLLPENPYVYMYKRSLDTAQYIIISNLSEENVMIPAIEGITYKADDLLLATHEQQFEDSATLVLQPFEARIYKLA